MRSFLGLANYYRKFITNFATIAALITDLTKKRMPNKVVWPAQERAFKTLRDLLTSSPILRLPNLSRQFILRTDASDIGVGAVLLQQYEDGTFPVAYANKKLLKREQNYFIVIERECLAIVYGVKKFQKYLYGKEFVIQTDHAPLSCIQRCRVESARIMRWSLFLQNYRFHIEAIKGSENVGADYLSRQ